MNFEQVLINSLVNSIKKEYTSLEAPDFFKLSSYDIDETLTIFLKFIQLSEESFETDFNKSNLEGLISYICNSKVIETYINDLIAPNVSGMQRTSLELFRDGIKQMESMGNLEDETIGIVHQMTMMLMPAPLASSLIMSSYLSLIDYQSGEFGTIDDFLEVLDMKEGQYLQLFESIIKLVVNPLSQVLQYRLLNLDKNIPMLFIMSLGSLSAKTYEEESESLIHQIEEGIKMTMDKIQGALKEPEDRIN